MCGSGRSTSRVRGWRPNWPAVGACRLRACRAGRRRSWWTVLGVPAVRARRRSARGRRPRGGGAPWCRCGARGRRGRPSACGTGGCVSTGFALDHHVGVDGYGDAPRRPFHAMPHRLTVVPAGCAVWSWSADGGEYPVVEPLRDDAIVAAARVRHTSRARSAAGLVAPAANCVADRATTRRRICISDRPAHGLTPCS